MFGKKKFRIAIVEDDYYFNVVLNKQISRLCTNKNYPDMAFEVKSYRTAREFLENFDSKIDLLLLDYYLEENAEGKIITGLTVLEKVMKRNPNCKVIVISGQKSVLVTAELFKKHIYDYIEKDRNTTNRTWALVQNILNHQGTH